MSDTLEDGLRDDCVLGERGAVPEKIRSAEGMMIVEVIVELTDEVINAYVGREAGVLQDRGPAGRRPKRQNFCANHITNVSAPWA